MCGNQHLKLITYFKTCTMKKIFVLLLSIGFVVSASAQKGNDRSNDRYDEKERIAYNDRYDNDRYRKNDRYRNNDRFDSYNHYREAIERVNRHYEFQMERVKMNRRLNWVEKTRAISMLKRERQERIEDINRRFQYRNDSRYRNGRGKRF